MTVALASKTAKVSLTKSWWRGFKRPRRNPELTTRRPESLEVCRAMSANPANMNRWQELLSRETAGLSASQVWNVDEKGFVLDSLPRRVVYAKQQRHVGQQDTRPHDHITTNVCMNAAGQFLPPQVIYSRAQIREALIAGAPTDTLFGHSEKGSMNSELFLDWFTMVFLKHTRRDVRHVCKAHNNIHRKTQNIIKAEKKAHLDVLYL